MIKTNKITSKILNHLIFLSFFNTRFFLSSTFLRGLMPRRKVLDLFPFFKIFLFILKNLGAQLPIIPLGVPLGAELPQLWELSSHNYFFFSISTLTTSNSLLLGRMTVKIPSFKLALIFFSSTSQGKITERENLPQ